MLRIHKSTDTKTAAWTNHLDTITTPTQLHLTRHHTEECIANVLLAEDQIPLLEAGGSTLTGQSRNRVQFKILVGVHNKNRKECALKLKSA